MFAFCIPALGPGFEGKAPSHRIRQKEKTHHQKRNQGKGAAVVKLWMADPKIQSVLRDTRVEIIYGKIRIRWYHFFSHKIYFEFNFHNDGSGYGCLRSDFCGGNAHAG